MQSNTYYVDVILPLAVEGTYTYHCTKSQAEKLVQGIRVALPFGKQKIQTGIVLRVHKNPPAFETKPVLEIIDKEPIINERLWKLIDFIVPYYITPVGKVIRSILPASFLLESQSIFALTEMPDKTKLGDDAFMLVEAMEKAGFIKISEAGKIIGSERKALKILNNLAEKGYVALHYEIKEKYKPKFISYIDLHNKDKSLKQILENFPSRAKKQWELLLYFSSLYLPSKQPVLKQKLLEKFNPGILKQLINKEILTELKVPVDRQVFEEVIPEEIRLNPAQQSALQSIKTGFALHKPVLLHGITAAGKTEIYMKLIEEVLSQNKQVLYLVPEIGLTTQLVERLKSKFGNRTAVYHSRFSPAERREIWMHALHGDRQASLVVGTRSALFVPLKNPGLIIVDEEHDESYKENQSQPMYNSRDLAAVLSKFFKIPVLFGSATPAFDSYFNAQKGKYHYVPLLEKYHQTPEPEKIILDFKTAYKEGRVKNDFITDTLQHIRRTHDAGLQTLVFLNKRGYAPIVTCKNCGYTENCPNCSVSLTYHRSQGKLKCHYCGYAIPKSNVCRSCGSTNLSIEGTGTEKIENQLKEIFPRYHIARMDSETTRSKSKLAGLITSFENGEIDILVGTQMLTKGLDFGRIGLVVVVNADRMIHFPEFRAHEKAFHMLVQVAGRTGRRRRKDTVIVQTFQPEHPVLNAFLKNDYEWMFNREMTERKLFKYPPFYRLILFEIKSKNPQNLHEAAKWLFRALSYYFPLVLGPSEPAIYKVKNYYRLEILLKIEADKNTMSARQRIRDILLKFKTIGPFKNVQIKINPDPA